MRVALQIERPASEEFALACGLLRAHTIDGVPLARLAQEYGFSPVRLRAMLVHHVSVCANALGIEPLAAPAPETAPEVPPANPPIRVRERIRVA